jgi:nucleotide-binding universal stress UspA family protein
MYQRILVATDGSTLARKAVKGAIELAAALGASLVAVHVVPRYPTSYFEGAVALRPEEIGRIERQWAEHGQAVADKVRAAAQARGVEVRTVLMQSDRISQSLLAAARKHGCDLIVMASHGRKGLQRILLGSETQQVLTHSSLPVLVLR